jgi:CHAT domain-containing protein
LSGRTQHALRRLHELLIEPIRAQLPAGRGSRLTIVPHGPLLHLSFAALAGPDGRYLVEDHAVHYVPAIGALRFTAAADARARKTPPRYLLVADPAIEVPPGGPALAPLPGSRAEVRALAGLMPRGSTTMLTGEEATEERVRSLAPSHSLLHIATHGVAADSSVAAPWLAMAGARAAAADGRLTADEIYGLDLRAELVFLSACRSGAGRLSGDGVHGLTRAFFYAGTPSVVAALWDLADEPSAELVPAFYRAWLRGGDKAAALREAQLALLRRLRAGQVRVSNPAGSFALPEHPGLWAGLVLHGQP